MFDAVDGMELVQGAPRSRFVAAPPVAQPAECAVTSAKCRMKALPEVPVGYTPSMAGFQTRRV